jgi:hypothetical protein
MFHPHILGVLHKDLDSMIKCYIFIYENFLNTEE